MVNKSNCGKEQRLKYYSCLCVHALLRNEIPKFYPMFQWLLMCDNRYHSSVAFEAVVDTAVSFPRKSSFILSKHCQEVHEDTYMSLHGPSRLSRALGLVAKKPRNPTNYLHTSIPTEPDLTSGCEVR